MNLTQSGYLVSVCGISGILQSQKVRCKFTGKHQGSERPFRAGIDSHAHPPLTLVTGGGAEFSHFWQPQAMTSSNAEDGVQKRSFLPYLLSINRSKTKVRVLDLSLSLGLSPQLSLYNVITCANKNRT